MATTSITITGVYLNPTLASACGVPRPKMFFRFDSAKVKNSDSDTIEKLAKRLSDGPFKGKLLDIVGRTDPRVSDEYKKRLGKSRVDEVEEPRDPSAVFLAPRARQ